jgi:AraC-type transcriptional regulator N-terminus
LTLSRRTGPTAPASGTYEPSVAVLAQGRKRVTLGQTTFIFDESRFLLTSLDLPIIGEVIEASEERSLFSVCYSSSKCPLSGSS